jgi:hypothetical protein
MNSPRSMAQESGEVVAHIREGEIAGFSDELGAIVMRRRATGYLRRAVRDFSAVD